MGRELASAFAAFGFVLAASAAAQEPAPGREPARSPVCEPRRSEDRIEGLTERGEIRLASGRVAKLAGIRRAAEPAHDEAGAAWLRSFAGSPVEVAALASEPDRWGRLPAILTARSDAGPIDLNRGLVAAGLALVDAGEADRVCQPELLAAEARARDFRLGLWRDDRYKPVAAADVGTLRARAGQFALVEGRIRSVGERPRCTYLNFGADWNADFTITIPQRTWRTMRDRGLSAAGLRGRLVRARGLIEEWRGPAITIMAPEMLEILDEDISRRR
jgi:endonuclease YncB( thermonuclease family)